MTPATPLVVMHGAGGSAVAVPEPPPTALWEPLSVSRLVSVPDAQSGPGEEALGQGRTQCCMDGGEGVLQSGTSVGDRRGPVWTGGRGCSSTQCPTGGPGLSGAAVKREGRGRGLQ